MGRKIVGVDIDGVLNRYGRHFCQELKRKSGKEIEYSKISRIPITDCPNVDVNIEDVLLVFNDPEFWQRVPPDEFAAEGLRELFEKNYSIIIFTYRPWPHLDVSNDLQVKKTIDEWQKYGFALSKPKDAIRDITKDWLEESKMVFDTLFVMTDRNMIETDRFEYCKLNSVDVFVEDDMSNAKRLAEFVTTVIVVDRPWNRDGRGNMPENVVFTSGWTEIVSRGN